MIPIDFDELAEFLKACPWLSPDECSPAQPPATDGRPLMQTNPNLAKKVIAFDGPQPVALRAFVLQAQALVGMSNRAGTPVGWAREGAHAADATSARRRATSQTDCGNR
jgi:hypothetical protein